MAREEQMAMIQAEKLTMAEQQVIDKAILSILNIWPGLSYGEFPGEAVTSGYELRLIRLSPAMLRTRRVNALLAKWQGNEL